MDRYSVREASLPQGNLPDALLGHLGRGDGKWKEDCALWRTRIDENLILVPGASSGIGGGKWGSVDGGSMTEQPCGDDDCLHGWLWKQ